MSTTRDLVSYRGTAARVTGPPAEVRAILERVHRAGRLVMFSPPQPTAGGQILVRVQLRPLTAAAPAASPARPRWWTPRRITIAVAATILLGAVGVATVLLVAWVLAHLMQVAAGAAVVGLLLVLAGKTLRVCPGVVVHCRGCKH